MHECLNEDNRFSAWEEMTRLLSELERGTRVLKQVCPFPQDEACSPAFREAAKRVCTAAQGLQTLLNQVETTK